MLKDNLYEVLNIKSFQSLMESFSELTSICSAILDLDGNVLLASGWQDICTKFHRKHPETNKNCIESDLYLTKNVKKGTSLLYKCKNNMWDIVAPIYQNDIHIANLFLGQFIFDDEKLDIDCFCKQAEKYGFNKKKYIE